MTDSRDRRRLEMARYSVLEQLSLGQIDVRSAAAAMRLSCRQTLRLKKKFKEKGIEVAVHGNRGRTPKNKLTPLESDTILKVFRQWKEATDEGVNSSHLADILARDYSLEVSRQTTWRLLKSHGLQVTTRRVRKHRKKRDRREQMGDLLYLDGSPHRWFGEKYPRITLVLCSDDATTAALYGVFVPEEDRNSCFEVCYEVFRKFGLPRSFWLDRASQFITTRGEGLHFKQTPQPTHWQNAMYLLGVRSIFAHSPQARGRGERLNGTFQDRLCAELQYRKISDLKSATKFLNEVFIPEINQRFSKTPFESVSAWRTAPDNETLRSILSAKTERRVLNDNTVKHKGRRFQIEPSEIRKSYAGRTVVVEERFDRSIEIVDGSRLLKYFEINEPATLTKISGVTKQQAALEMTSHVRPGEGRCDRIAVTDG